MPEPQPIKDGCLQGGNVNAYGGREEIRRLVMGTRPEEFAPVVDAYKKTSQLLTDTIAALGDSAARLVADGNWGGESARAMLTRMNRLQTYLQSLRNGVDGVPPGLETMSGELASAKERFDKATEQQEYWVEASGMGAGSMQPLNDPDADARAFMQQLNGAYQRAYTVMPDRLAWDAELASPAPYLPPPVDPVPGPAQGGDLPYESTIPVRSRTDLAGTPGHPSTPAGPLPGQAAVPGAPAGTSPPTSLATSLASSPPVGGPVMGAAPGAGQPSPAGNTPPAGLPPSPGTAPTPAGTARPPGDLGTGRPGTNRPVTTNRGNPADPYQGRPADPRTSAAQEPAGPSVRPGSVPVVDGSWPPARSPVAGAEPGATASGGVPFLPMGGPADGGQNTRRPIASKSDDDDFFRPAVVHGPPVVG
ncbi:hypothetical protein ACIBQ1_05055 [Nonomuraea sp. NPDC050153]|uniref:hypothetical protein n=1 Tax=Nonomuraea sp. NPDC050153 TaxID=3364359 RepID=UPI00378F4790